jgi:putative spermidine/putrescine transport system ATP-binding protein
MSDRIAVFNRGRVEQVGTPPEIYEHPATAFVAGFVGTSNVLSGPVAEAVLGEPGTVSVRPERIRLGSPDGPPEGADVTAAGTVADVVYAGPETRFVVDLDAGARMVASRPNGGPAPVTYQPGQRVLLGWQRQHTARIPAGAPEPAAARTSIDG